jgi:hypothetical protein
MARSQDRRVPSRNCVHHPRQMRAFEMRSRDRVLDLLLLVCDGDFVVASVWRGALIAAQSRLVSSYVRAVRTASGATAD